MSLAPGSAYEGRVIEVCEEDRDAEEGRDDGHADNMGHASRFCERLLADRIMNNAALRILMGYVMLQGTHASPQSPKP